MERLERWSERYPTSGSTAARGILKTLGKPALELLELFTREAIQNCWDAATNPGIVPVRVEIRVDELEESRRNGICDLILADTPPVIGLDSALERSSQLLVVSDRGTDGLSGPTRADLPTGGPMDFVAFLRNVGEPPDKPVGGGSFGFGKAALYLASLAHVIVVHTRTRNERGELETRFIAAGLSDEYVETVDGAPVRMTGRHFWGVTDHTLDLSEPVRGKEASAFAQALGLSPFEQNETGTDIAILCPDLSVASDSDTDPDSGRRRAMELIARSVAWHFWPKIYGPEPSMEISVSLDGDPVKIPSPESNSRLAAFHSAMCSLGGERGPEVPLRLESYEVWSQRPRRFLGNLVIETHPVSDVLPPADPIAAPESASPLRHVALMRNAELVVKYLEGPALPGAGHGYAGVFKVAPGDEELDGIFRDAEPPSHDDWVSKALDDRSSRVFVNVALRRVAECMNEYAGRGGPASGAVHEVPLGAISRQLAQLIPMASGDGAGPEPGTNTPVGSRKRPPLTIRKPLAPVAAGGGLLFEAEVEVHDTVEVRARAFVAVLDGARPETQAPEGAPVPIVTGWRGPSGRGISGDTVNAREGEAWTVSIASQPDVMVIAEFEVTE